MPGQDQHLQRVCACPGGGWVTSGTFQHLPHPGHAVATAGGCRGRFWGAGWHQLCLVLLPLSGCSVQSSATITSTLRTRRGGHWGRVLLCWCCSLSRIASAPREGCSTRSGFSQVSGEMLVSAREGSGLSPAGLCRRTYICLQEPDG